MNVFKTKSWSLFLTISLFNISLLQAQLVKIIDEKDTARFMSILDKTEIEKINAIDKKTNYTPLTRALYANNTLFAKALIEKGADVNLQDGNKASPVFLAVEKRNREITEKILNKGVDVNQAGDYGTTLLHKAVENSDFDMIRLLLSHKADINAVDNHGNTALAISMDKSPYRKENKFFPNEYGSEDKYYILSSDMPSDPIAINDTLDKSVKAMDVKLFEQNGKKHLDLPTVYEIYAPITYLLVKSGARLCLDDKKTTNPFVSAWGPDHFYQKMLLYTHIKDCSPENRDILIKAAIESSLESGDPFFVEVLLLDDANIPVIKSLDSDKILNTVFDKLTRTSFYYKHTSNERNPGVNPVLGSSYCNALKGLLSKGLKDTSGLVMEWADLNNGSGFALSNGDKGDIFELMRLSAVSGCNPNMVIKNDREPLLLMLTHEYGYSQLEHRLSKVYPPYYEAIIEVIKVLIKNGASLNPTYNGNDSHYVNNWTPLSHAIGDDSEELIRLYVSNGARMDIDLVKYKFMAAPDNIKKILLDAGYKSE